MERLYSTMRRAALALGAILALSAPLAGQTAGEAKLAAFKAKHDAARSAFTLRGAGDFDYFINVNNWQCGIDDRGLSCTSVSGSTTGAGGVWPAGSGNQYVFQFGLHLAARDPINPDGFVATHCFNVSSTNAQCTTSNQGIYHSDDPEDLAVWPEECYLWNPQTGEPVKSLSQNDTCVTYNDFTPAFTVPGGHPMGVQVTQHTMAFTLSGFENMLFFIYKIKNVSHTAAFKSANPNLAIPAGGWTLNDFYIGVGHDADVSGVDLDANYGTFVPFLNDSTPLNLATIWVADFEAADFSPYAQCGFCSVPGFVGTTFLRSPYNNTGETLTIRNGDLVREVPSIDQATLETLRLAAAKGDVAAQQELEQYEIGQSFGSLTTKGPPFEDAEEAGQTWRYLSGNLSPEEKQLVSTSPPGFGYVDQPSPIDTRYFHATGPVTLAPGDSVEVIVGMVAGAPVLDVPGFTPGVEVPHGLPGDTTRLIEKIMGRGRTHTAYPSLFKGVLDARQLFETNFLLPSPPPAPQVTAIPGDQEVALTWSADPVDYLDPYAPIAEARGIPGFREKDFEGFRVYRKVRPNDPWTLIAQFDLKNGIGARVTTVDSVLSADGQYITIRADTAKFCVPVREDRPTEIAACTADTGLKFSLIDRGGPFQNTENGPGLTNGVTYHYAVTSFDINTPFAPGGSSLESGKTPPRGVQQNFGGASAQPRSTTTGLVAAQITEPGIYGGNVKLDPDATVTIDPATGTFSGPQPPTNAFTAEFLALNGVMLPQGSVSATIDSVVVLNGYESLYGEEALGGHNELGVAVAYYLTVTTAEGSEPVRVEFPAPFGYYTSNPVQEASLFDLSVKADPAKAQELGYASTPFAASFSASMKYGPEYENSGAEAVGAFRAHQVHEEGGSRWFVGTEPAEPTLGTKHGELPGVTNIYGMPYFYANSSNPANRWITYTSASWQRAADVEITWGESGTIESVFDVTHNVEVPFSDHYGATWGFHQDGSGDGVLSQGDWWYVTPTAEWYCEVEGCHTPLVNQATIQPISNEALAGYADTPTGGATGQGFSLFINGEYYIFETTQLPAAGTKWTLRSYAGDVQKGDDGTYTFTMNEYRPPAVPGLTLKVDIEAAATLDASVATLDNVHTVPDPFVVSSVLQTSPFNRRLQFVNLPPKATIRIFSLSGVLVDAIEFEDPSGAGSVDWDLRNRNNQYVASGIYFYHVETPDGKSKVGKFTIIQAP